MPKHYRLIVTGSVPLTFEDTEEVPQTPQAWHDLLESSEVSLYELDNLTLQLVPMTPEEIAADEAELQRKILYAKEVGERMRRAYNERQPHS
jgi:hypothetical protein